MMAEIEELLAKLKELDLETWEKCYLWMETNEMMGKASKWVPIITWLPVGISWVIIGAETGNRKGKVAPELEWIEQIIAEADSHGIPVFMKDSLKIIPGIDRIWRRELEDRS